jgi:monoamine oxidase
MSKSPLFQRLRRLARQAGCAVKQHRASGVEGPPDTRQISRRDLGRAGIGLSLGAGLTALGCSSDTAEEKPRVAVIGAGLAGLHCAWRLHQAGVSVTVYEASSRVGGRTYTDRKSYAPQVCELGGELVDTNHRFMWALCDELEITLDDRQAGTYATKAVDTWYVLGGPVSDETILEQFAAVAEAIVQAVEAADSDDAEFEALDNTSLDDWLAQHVDETLYPELHSVLQCAYRGEFGLETAEQSALNLIYLIGTDDTEFALFGESDERYHIHGGNDQITTRLAKRLGEKVALEHRLSKVVAIEDGYELSFSSSAPDTDAGASAGTGTIKVEADYVVFALPFTQLRKVDLDDAGLSADKREIIDELGYGTNAKLMGAFSSRIWAEEHDTSGSVTTDLPFQQAWETSIGQAGAQGILTNFLGGEAGAESGQGTAEERFTSILDDLDRVYPGVRNAYVAGSAVRMHWPSHPFTSGSYTCYRPGQWAYWGTEGLPEGRAHFCGEHTSAEFQGWMEGAAETGGRVAIEILNELGLEIPKELAAVVDDVTALPGQELQSLLFPRRLARARGRAT